MRKTQIQGVAFALLGGLSIVALWISGHPIIAAWAAAASLGLLFVQGAAMVSDDETEDALERRREAGSSQPSSEDEATIPPFDGQSGQD